MHPAAPSVGPDRLSSASPPSRGAVDVSVLVITYNHERYIETALASVFAQRTTRRLEVIVSEDRSTDRTFEIVRAFADAHGPVAILRSEKNLASNAVLTRAIAAASGKYICLLDGDDFWTDVEKVDKQAEILDRSPCFSAVFHNAAVVDGESRQIAERWTPAHHPELLDLPALWEGNPFATCAGMLRREPLARLGPWYDDFFPITDWPLYILCAASGPIAFYDAPVGGYRLHAAGMFSSLPTTGKLDQVAQFYRLMRRTVSPEQQSLRRDGETRYFYEWALAYERERNFRLALNCLARAARAAGPGGPVPLARMMRAGLRMLPGVIGKAAA
jgi:glycosyltransferase involved in cell wall biosynthesis